MPALRTWDSTYKTSSICSNSIYWVLPILMSWSVCANQILLLSCLWDWPVCSLLIPSKPEWKPGVKPGAVQYSSAHESMKRKRPNISAFTSDLSLCAAKDVRQYHHQIKSRSRLTKGNGCFRPCQIVERSSWLCWDHTVGEGNSGPFRSATSRR